MRRARAALAVSFMLSLAGCTYPTTVDSAEKVLADTHQKCSDEVSSAWEVEFEVGQGSNVAYLVYWVDEGYSTEIVECVSQYLFGFDITRSQFAPEDQPAWDEFFAQVGFDSGEQSQEFDTLFVSTWTKPFDFERAHFLRYRFTFMWYLERPELR